MPGRQLAVPPGCTMVAPEPGLKPVVDGVLEQQERIRFDFGR